MPSIKRSGVKSREVKTGFEAYDGPEPNKRGVYRSRIVQFNYKQFRSGATGYAILLELEAQKGDPKGHAQYDGYPIWTNIVFGDKEAMITREENLNAALGVKDEPNVVFEDGNIESGVKVKTIGGKNPIGAIVNADIKMGSFEGNPRPEVDSIFKVREIDSKVSKAVVSEEEPEEEDEEGSDEMSYDDRLTELKSSSIGDLRRIAEEDYDLEIKGLKKVDLVQAILDEEFPPEDEEDDEEPEDEAEDEEDDEAEDDEDDDDEEDDEEDERAEREAELSELTRIQLKSALRKVDPDFTVKKSHTEQNLVQAILDAEFGPEDEDEETPF